MEGKQKQDPIITQIAQAVAKAGLGEVSKARAKRDLAGDCKALEITSATAALAGSVASEAVGVAASASIFGTPAATVAAGVAITAYSLQYSVDIAHIELGCDDIPFNEIKEIMDERFNKVDKAIDRNYDAIVKVDAKVDQVLSEVQQTRIEMRRGFQDVLTKLTSIEILQTLSDLKTFVAYFDKETARINTLSQKKYITRINETTKFLDALNKERSPGDKTLFSIVYQIINRNFADPENADHVDAWSALYSLYYAAQTYVSMVLFLTKQHARLADYYYNIGDVDTYNHYFDELQIVFENFKETLAGNNLLIDRIVGVMERVKAKDFVADNKDLTETLNSKISSLKKMENDILEMELPIITDDVDGLNSYTSFDGTSPIEDWQTTGDVSYALQYKTGKLYSKLGDWYTFRLNGQANPVLRIPGGPEGKQKLIFRKFNNDKAQLVGVLDDENELEYPDVNRDLYNAASYSWANDAAAKSAIETLIGKGVDMNARFEHGRTAIHAAAVGGIEQVARILLEKNPSYINMPDDNGYTPLHLAAERGDDKFIELLIQKGVDVNTQTYSEKLTALHLAVRNGYGFAFKALLQAENINIYARDVDGFTPIHLAVSRGLSFVESVLQKGNPEINLKSAAGITLLHMAAMSNNLKFAQSLAAKSDLQVNAVAADDFTPLHFAVLSGHLQMVQFLLQHGANVNAATNTKWTPLHFAVTLHREDIVTALIAQQGIKIDARADGSSPFHLAVGTGQVSIAQKLLDKGARIKAITKNFATPLHIASMHRNLGMVEFLLNNNADLEAKVTSRYEANNKTPGYTPLLTAALVGNLDIVQHLVEKGANINATERGGDNVLHIAAKNGHLEVVKFLESRFNIAADTKVLESAIKGGRLNVVRYLVDEKNANVNTRAIFDVAVNAGHPNIIKYLINEKHYNVSCDNTNDCLYLAKASEFGYLEMVQFLLKNQRLNLHQGAIQQAIIHGQTDILDHFLEKRLMTNADLRRYAIDNDYISLVAGFSGLKMVKYLADKANIRRDELIRFALNKAIQRTNLEVIKYIVQDADINSVRFGGGESVLHAAVRQGISGDSRPVLRYFVDEKGANVNAKNNNGDTALDVAIKENFQSIPVQFLVSRGAVLNPSRGYGSNVNSDINEVISNQPGCNSIIEGQQINSNFLGYRCIDTTKRIKEYDVYFTTPLILAISKGNVNLANQLIDGGADVRGTDVAGNTPLHIAAEHGYLDLINKLIQKGASVTVENKAYQLPLILAYANYNRQIIDVLLAAKESQASQGQQSRYRRSIKETASPINVVEYLNEHGCNISDASENGGTPLCLGNLNGKQETTEFKNPLCAQHNFSLGLLLLQNFLDKKYPLPRFTEMNSEKSRTFALQIAYKFEQILHNAVKISHAESNSLNFYKLYREIEANIRQEKFSNVPKVLVDFVNEVCTNEKSVESVVDKIGKWFSKV